MQQSEHSVTIFIKSYVTIYAQDIFGLICILNRRMDQNTDCENMKPNLTKFRQHRAESRV